MAVRIENKHPLGRLADIDVLSNTGEPVARADLGLPPRACFLCGEPAVLCRPINRHSREALMEFVGAMLQCKSGPCDFHNPADGFYNHDA
jgi:holo-ACP synthase CitX